MRRLVHAARPGLRRAFIPANSRVNSSSANHAPLNKEEALLPPPPPPPPNAAPDTANHVNELAHGRTRLPQQGSAPTHTNSWMNRVLDAVTQSGGPSTSMEGRRQEEAEGVHQTGEVQHSESCTSAAGASLWFTVSDAKDVSTDEIRAELQPHVHSATSYEPSLDIITSGELSSTISSVSFLTLASCYRCPCWACRTILRPPRSRIGCTDHSLIFIIFIILITTIGWFRRTHST
jgi:hypothetical protein